MGETSETLKKWSRLVAQAWADEKLKQQLVDNPTRVLQEHEIEVPAGVEIRVVENTDKVSYLMLPPKPAGDVAELTSGQLSGVAGGFCCSIYSNAPSGPDISEITISKRTDSSSVNLY